MADAAEEIIEAMRRECYNADSYATMRRYPDDTFRRMLRSLLMAASEAFVHDTAVMKEDTGLCT